MKIRGRIALDYTDAPSSVIENLSGVAQDGDSLWTVSDEGRSIERLDPAADGFKLAERFGVDDLIDDVPGAGDGPDDGDELDLESVAIAGGRLWICGSHCNVRRKPETDGVLNPQIRKRKGRCLIARFALEGGKLRGGDSLPVSGDRSLRSHLRQNPYLAPFLNLPSKENGLDIEGFALRGGSAFLGLRGPRLDSIAAVIELSLDSGFDIERSRLHLIDMGGLSVRDIAVANEDMLLIAGPVGDAPGPFELRRWRPRKTDQTQQTEVVFSWPGDGEKPEAICPGRFLGEDGVLCLYDSPAADRLTDKGRYLADILS
jgi:hypothetical protein